jgi:hypothetical protein
MIDSKSKGLMVVEALRGTASIEATVPVHEVAAAVMAGVVVVIKNAFEPSELRRLRTAIVSANLPFREPGFHDSESWRNRREVYLESVLDVLYDSSFLAVDNPADEIGCLASSTAERLAAYWRALTGDKHTFVAEANRRALRCWAMQYPIGGGCFGWHQHKLEPTKIGLILALSEIGVDFRSGGTEFRTPFGVVDVMQHHDIGDLCLFRYDLPHRVAAVDSGRVRKWDGSGRWTFLIQGDPRPVAPLTA